LGPAAGPFFGMAKIGGFSFFSNGKTKL
jgi:hypothetical protein